MNKKIIIGLIILLFLTSIVKSYESRPAYYSQAYTDLQTQFNWKQTATEGVLISPDGNQKAFQHPEEGNVVGNVVIIYTNPTTHDTTTVQISGDVIINGINNGIPTYTDAQGKPGQGLPLPIQQPPSTTDPQAANDAIAANQQANPSISATAGGPANSQTPTPSSTAATRLNEILGGGTPQSGGTSTTGGTSSTPSTVGTGTGQTGVNPVQELRDVSRTIEEEGRLQDSINNKINRYQGDPARLANRLTQEEFDYLNKNSLGFMISKNDLAVVSASRQDPNLERDRDLITAGKLNKLTDQELIRAQSNPEIYGLSQADWEKANNILDIREKLRTKSVDELAKSMTSDKALDDFIQIAREYGDSSLRFKAWNVKMTVMQNKAEANKEWASEWFSLVRPNAVGTTVQKWINDAAGHDVGWNLLESDSELVRNVFGFAMSGYEHWICDGLHDRPEQIIQSAPGVYAGGFSLPGASSMLVLLGRRTEYDNANWTDHAGQKWFPEIQPDGTMKAKGYLYKISWTLSNPVTNAEYDNMGEAEKNENGLLMNGTIEYTITVTGKNENGADVSYVWDALPAVELEKIESKTLVFYDKSKLTNILLTFKGGHKYDGAHTTKTADITVQDLTYNIPADFNYFPATNQTTSSITYTYPDGTVVNSTSSKCNAPPGWCCDQGIIAYC